MKKLVCILLCFGLVLGLSACGGARVEGDYIVYMPDGATALSLSYMMENYETIDDATVGYNVVTPETIAGFVKNGTADIAILPVNAAVNLFKQGAEYKMRAVVTHGNLFFIGAEGETLADLKGKQIASIGQGAIPQLVLEYLLKENDINIVYDQAASANDVSITYYGDGSDVIKALSQGSADIGFIAEPAATTAVGKLAAKGVKILINAQEEWTTLTGEDGFPQAALLVKNGTDEAFVKEFLRLCKKGDGWAAESEENTAKALAAIKAHPAAGTETTTFSITPEIINLCNIRTMTSGIKEYVEEFFTAVGFDYPDNLADFFA